MEIQFFFLFIFSFSSCQIPSVDEFGSSPKYNAPSWSFQHQYKVKEYFKDDLVSVLNVYFDYNKGIEKYESNMQPYKITSVTDFRNVKKKPSFHKFFFNLENFLQKRHVLYWSDDGCRKCLENNINAQMNLPKSFSEWKFKTKEENLHRWSIKSHLVLQSTYTERIVETKDQFDRYPVSLVYLGEGRLSDYNRTLLFQDYKEKIENIDQNGFEDLECKETIVPSDIFLNLPRYIVDNINQYVSL